MRKNMTPIDRALRAFVVAPAAILVAIFVVGAGTVWAILLFVLAGIMLATGVTGYCPLYTLVRTTRASGGRPLPH